MKRRLFTILIFLLLGAVVNVAVAWACTAWEGPVIGPWERNNIAMRATIDQPDDSWIRVYEWRGFGVRIHQLEDSTVQPIGPYQEEGGYVTARWLPKEIEDLDIPGAPKGPMRIPLKRPSWTQIGHWDNGLDVGVYSEQARGWPALSLWSALSTYSDEWPPGTASDNVFISGIPWDWIRPGAGPSRLTREKRALPLCPIWPGFVFNTLFYGLLLWLPIRGPFVLRRYLRRKRGQCLKCGYDLRGDLVRGCPECGWNREEIKA